MPAASFIRDRFCTHILIIVALLKSRSRPELVTNPGAHPPRARTADARCKATTEYRLLCSRSLALA